MESTDHNSRIIVKNYFLRINQYRLINYDKMTAEDPRVSLRKIFRSHVVKTFIYNSNNSNI